MSSLDITPGEFRRLSNRVAQVAEGYLAGIDQRPTSPPCTGAQSEALFRSDLPEQGLGDAALDGLQEIVNCSRSQNARFFGYVLGSGEPVAAVADLLASVINQNVTAWRSGPAAVTIERTVVGWLAQAIQCPEFHGSLTGGGSAANLMGLAMAREAMHPANERGLKHAPQAVVYASQEVHMSIPKSVALLGIGRDSLRLIPTDRALRMVPLELEKAIKRDLAAGHRPIAIVASAGTVNTGAVDPLAEIAAIARAHGLWLHIDGAYGALAAIAIPEKFSSLRLADSLSLDPHKWLYQPIDCGCVLYRDRDGVSPARAAFSHTGDYAKSLTADPVEGFAFFDETLELSRRFRALRLWLSLRYHGMAAFRAAIKKDLELARKLASLVKEQRELELLAETELSAVCFRYRGEGGSTDAELNRRNAEILKRVLARGRVYLSNATLGGRFALRACLVNHRTTENDIREVINEVLAAARK